MRGVGEDDGALDARHLVGDLLEQRQEGEIGHHHAVLGVVDDPDDLLGEQARIDGVVDGADTDNAVPAFQVPPGVPGERRHAVAELDAVAFEALRYAQRARADFGVVGVVKRAFDRTRDHRPFAVVDGGMIDDAMAKERPILHEAEHDIPPGIGFIWFLP